jgi:hypothetical protein
MIMNNNEKCHHVKVCIGTWGVSQEEWYSHWKCIKCTTEWVTEECTSEPIYSEAQVEKIQAHWIKNPTCFDFN